MHCSRNHPAAIVRDNIHCVTLIKLAYKHYEHGLHWCTIVWNVMYDERLIEMNLLICAIELSTRDWSVLNNTTRIAVLQFMLHAVP